MGMGVPQHPRHRELPLTSWLSVLAFFSLYKCTVGILRSLTRTEQLSIAFAKWQLKMWNGANLSFSTHSLACK